MKNLYIFTILCFINFTLISYGLAPDDYKAGLRKGVTSGYYLGFTSLADEMRELRRPSDIPVGEGFLKSFICRFSLRKPRI